MIDQSVNYISDDNYFSNETGSKHKIDKKEMN